MSQSGGGGRSSTQQQPAARRINPIRPLTIKQILQAQNSAESALVVDGRELTQATVVGRIVSYESANMGVGGALTAKHFGYRITDNTGMIVVRQWIEAESPEEPIPIGSHVRAAGTVKMWQASPVVTGTVVAMADTNELNYHMLDAILTHLRLTQGNKRPTAGSGGFVHNTPEGVGHANMLPGGMDKIPVVDLVVNVIRGSSSGDVGLSMDEIIAALQRYHCDASEVRGALRVLVSEGKIYETHDKRFNI